MNDIAEGLADNYNLSQEAGKKEITRSWRALRPETRAWLTSTGHYNDRGTPIQVESGEAEVEDLEYNFGLMIRCVEAKLPNRTEKGAPIPSEATNSEIPSALAALIYLPIGQDPVFLRRALLALQRFEMARLLCVLPAQKESSSLQDIGRLAFGLFCLVLLLVSPAILAGGLVSAANGDYGDTSAALYALGFIAWMLNILRGLGKDGPGTIDEQTYKAWAALNPYQSGNWTVGGAGASAYFSEMSRKGLQVPAVAFDLCESLKAQVLRPDPASEKLTTIR